MNTRSAQVVGPSSSRAISRCRLGLLFSVQSPVVLAPLFTNPHSCVPVISVLVRQKRAGKGLSVETYTSLAEALVTLVPPYAGRTIRSSWEVLRDVGREGVKSVYGGVAVFQGSRRIPHGRGKEPHSVRDLAGHIRYVAGVG